MSSSDAGVLDGQVAVVDGGDVNASVRLLSVAEIQRAFRDLRSGRSEPAHTTALAGTEAPYTSRTPDEPRCPAVETTLSQSPHTSHEPDNDAASASPHTSPKPAEVAGIGGGRLGREWIVVISAHAGAGASCAALAVADALSAEGRPCRLIETATPARSGLVAAPNVELGFDASGAWRRGGRSQATLYRRAHDSAPTGWPEQASADPIMTVVDGGLPSPANLQRIAENRPTVVVTCRSTIPGVRMAEHVLAAVGDAPVVMVAIGRSRWPGNLNASVGPRLQRLRHADRVVCMPVDRRLQVTGPTNSPLPKSVTAAGRAVLRLIDVARTGGADTTTHSLLRGTASS